MAKYRYLIIGGGVAAGYAAKELADQGTPAGEVCILSADNHLPYERPSLSKEFLRGEEDVAEILINPANFYKTKGIEVHLETVAGSTDLDHKLVYANNQAYGYEKLLIATGARPIHFDLPGSDLENIFYLRRLDHSNNIRSAAKRSDRAVVIGGSFIGMEAAASLRQLGVEVSMVFMEPRVWEPLFTPEMSNFFEAYLKDHGIEIYSEETVAHFEGVQGAVQTVVIESGERLPADLVVAGIGVIPNTELVENSPLQIDDGILVNRFLETNMPDVYAVGDVARYRDVIFQRALRFEHWDNAVSQAELAARGMLGKREKYEHVPYFFSDVFDLSYEYWGDNRGANHVVYRGDLESGSFSTWWLQNDQLIAAFVMDRLDEERTAAQEWIKTGQTINKEDLSENLKILQQAGS